MAFLLPFPRGKPEDPIFGPRTVNNRSDCFRLLMTEAETETSHPSNQENIPNLKKGYTRSKFQLNLLRLFSSLVSFSSSSVRNRDTTYIALYWSNKGSWSISTIWWPLTFRMSSYLSLILGKLNLNYDFKLTFVSKVDNYCYQLFLQQFAVKDWNMQC